MHVLVTRPWREAQRWCAQLRQRGLSAEALPLIEIGAADPAPVAAAWQALAACRAAMFVSANAVEAFFAARPASTDWPLALRAWATGPGTARALLAAGVPPSSIDAPADDALQFDSEALWQRVGQGAALSGAQVLIVRGADAQGQLAGRPWLARQLAAQGVVVHELVAYRRCPPPWDAAERARVAALASGSVWLFSSSDAVHNLQALLPAQDWQVASAVATHARIASAARVAGFGRVAETRPVLDAVVASIESLR